MTERWDRVLLEFRIEHFPLGVKECVGIGRRKRKDYEERRRKVVHVRVGEFSSSVNTGGEQFNVGEIKNKRIW